MAEASCIVDGMTCNGCAAALQRALQPLVGDSTIDYQSGQVRIHDWQPTALNALRRTVEDAGFNLAQDPR